jgi:hypothetical protein
MGRRIGHLTAHAIGRLDWLARDRWLAEQSAQRNTRPVSLRVFDNLYACRISA